MAFVNYKVGVGFFDQQFVGLKYFYELFRDPRFFNALKNTIIMSSLGISICGFIMPITFALLINEVRHLHFKKAVQTISYLPHFVSWVVVSLMLIANALALSFNESGDSVRGGIHIWPREFTLANYAQVFQYDNLITAFALIRKDFMFRRPAILMFVVTMYVPGGLVPSYLLIKFIERTRKP